MRLRYQSARNIADRDEVAQHIGQTPVDDSPLRAPPSAWLGINHAAVARRPDIAVESEESDDDDPLVPRIRRIPPTRPMVANRRNTFSGISSLPDLRPSILPASHAAAGGSAARARRCSVEGDTRLRQMHLSLGDAVFEEDETDGATDADEGEEEGQGEGGAEGSGQRRRSRRAAAQDATEDSGPDMSMGGTSDSDSAHRPHPSDAPPDVPTTRMAESAPHPEDDTAPRPVDPSFDSDLAMQPLPPSLSLLPPYNPHLAPQEIRLISTVHLDQAHPSQTFFTALANSLVHAAPVPQDDPQREQPQEYTTGGKKMKLSLTKGGYRMNQNATGPLYVKVGRGGRIEGRVEVGKVDYASSVEVSVRPLISQFGCNLRRCHVL